MAYIVSIFGIALALLVLQIVALVLIGLMYADMRRLHERSKSAGRRRCH